MEAPSNPLFSNDLNEYEQYLLFLGYMEGVHEEMCKKSGDNKMNHKVDQLLMVCLNKKVVGTLFPDGKYDMQHLKYLGEQMKKLHLSDRVNDMLDTINQVAAGFKLEDVKKNPDLAQKVMEELFKP